jgi:hypothetical protein
VTDSAGNAYTLDLDDSSFSRNLRVVTFSARNVAALSSGQQITVHFDSAPHQAAVSITELSGVATVNPDQTQSAHGNNASPNSGNTSTTSFANEVLIGAIGYNSAATFTAGSGYTALTSAAGTNSGTTDTIAPEYRIVSATGQYAATGTLSSTPFTQGWLADIITYAAEAPATPTPKSCPTKPSTSR